MNRCAEAALVLVLLLAKLVPAEATTMGATDCVESASNDFLASASPSSQRLAPADCKVVADNPVSFTWAPPREAAVRGPWTLSVRSAAGKPVAEVSGERPRTTLPMVLPIGRYEWRLTYPRGSAGKVQSAWRRFEVGTSRTTSNDLPTASELILRLRAGTASRLLRSDMSWTEAHDATRKDANKSILEALLKRAASSVAMPLPLPPSSSDLEVADKPAQAAALLRLMHVTNRELESIESLAFAWCFTRNKDFLTAAKRRVLNLAS